MTESSTFVHYTRLRLTTVTLQLAMDRLPLPSFYPHFVAIAS